MSLRGLRRPSALVVALALLVVALAGAAGASSSAEVVYRGTMKIKVAYWDVSCPIRDTTLRLQKTRTYSMPVSVIRNPPASEGGINERNPFNLMVSADPTREAGITIWSATVTTDFSGRVLYEYWRFTQQGEKLQGRLTRSWRETGLAANLFPTDKLWIPCQPQFGTRGPFPETIKEGARLSGSATDERFELTITGQTYDRTRRFTASITATR